VPRGPRKWGDVAETLGIVLGLGIEAGKHEPREIQRYLPLRSGAAGVKSFVMGWRDPIFQTSYRL